MSYQIIVLIKQVPDTTAVSSKAMKEDGTLNRAALPAVFNPEDLNALELALEVRQRYGGRVFAVTMGPPSAAEILREALYRGIDRAFLLTDSRFAVSDTLATSYVLSHAIKKIGKYDLIICGRQAIDGNTAQVGPQVAEKLGLNQLTYVEEIEEIAEGKIILWRNIENGKEKAVAKLPVLLTVTDTANIPRPPSVKKFMRHKNAKTRSELPADSDLNRLKHKGLLIEEWGAETLNIDPALCGLSGSPTRVKKIENVVLKGKAFKKINPTDDGIKELLQGLIQDYTFD